MHFNLKPFLRLHFWSPAFAWHWLGGMGSFFLFIGTMYLSIMVLDIGPALPFAVAAVAVIMGIASHFFRAIPHYFAVREAIHWRKWAALAMPWLEGYTYAVKPTWLPGFSRVVSYPPGSNDSDGGIPEKLPSFFSSVSVEH